MASDDMILVKGYADLASDVKLQGDEPDVVARKLQEYAGDDGRLVAVLDEWLVDEKDLEGVDRHDRVVSGRIEAETDKAYLVAQGRTDDWLPKSCIRVYDAVDGADLAVPQHGLDSFAADGGAR